MNKRKFGEISISKDNINVKSGVMNERGEKMSTRRKGRKYSKGTYIAAVIILVVIWFMVNYPTIKDNWENQTGNQQNSGINDDIENASEVEGAAYKVVNNNQPYFTDDEKKSTEALEIYSELDDLGRCGVAYANICKELMPTEERGEIGHIKPSGWHSVKYDHVDGKYL